MRAFSVAEYVKHWDNLPSASKQCVFGVILYFGNELLLMDEGFSKGDYRGNSRLVLDYPDGEIALQNALPAIGGGPSPFWEIAIAVVEQRKIVRGAHVIVPKRIFYWDEANTEFHSLHLDKLRIEEAKIRSRRLKDAQSEISSTGEVDPFAEAGKFYYDYWSKKL